MLRRAYFALCMARIFFIICLSLLAATSGLAEPVLVGLFYGANHVRVTLKVISGSYDVVADNNVVFTIATSESADITAIDGAVNIFYDSKNYSGYSKIKLLQNGAALFKLQPAGQKPIARVYEQNLIAYPYMGRLQLVSEVEVENYVSGVIEAESGSGQELEYYKVQAVISRTYALNNLTRHALEGFQVCDATHCQVYHGKPRMEMKAAQAAEFTKDIVIVDHEINLITAAFHSNCGGRTLDADEVWSKPTTYLIGKCDTFCLTMPHSNWEKTVHRERWVDYLNTKRYPLTDNPTEQELSFYPSQKIKFYADSSVKIPMKTIREDFKLRSAFFNVQSVGDSVIFMGQGFGHGVGLCQEGAMRMARLGNGYENIIHFYYSDVHLIPRDMVWFYRE